MNDKPDAIAVVSYFLAAAVLIPIGWWMKANYAHDMGAWTLSLFH